MVRVGALSTQTLSTYCHCHQQLAFLAVSDSIAARDHESLREVGAKRQQKILFSVYKVKTQSEYFCAYHLFHS